MFIYFESFASFVLLDLHLEQYIKKCSGEYCYFCSVPRDVSVSEYYFCHNLLLETPFRALHCLRFNAWQSFLIFWD